MTRGCIGTVVVTVVTLAGLARGASETPKKILYIGNSFTLNRDVPGLVARIAASAGKPWPSYVGSLQESTDLAYHVGRLGGPDAWKLTSLKYDFVIIQGLSTEPTRIGNPTAYRANAVRLTQMVRAKSPGAIPIIEQTWAYQPQNKEVYPAKFPNPAAFNNDLSGGSWARRTTSIGRSALRSLASRAWGTSFATPTSGPISTRPTTGSTPVPEAACWRRSACIRRCTATTSATSRSRRQAGG
ncbi:MAG: hypothetical protein QM770_06135 [Tepidisphaeraceae bacterium]